MRASLVSILILGCGGSTTHPAVDGPPPDTSEATTTLTINSYRSTGPHNTTLVAVQDGDGAWTALTGNAGVYTAALHSDHYGVLTACQTMNGGGPSITYATVADGTTLYFADCEDGTLATANISGTITGAAPANPTRVTDAWFDDIDIPAGTTTYQIPSVPGPERLIAEEIVNDRPIKLVAADITAVDGQVVNFDLASGSAPVTQKVTADSAIGVATLSYRDVHGISRIDNGAAPFSDFRAMPAAQLGDGLNRLLVASADTTNAATVIRYFKQPADQAVTFPQPFAFATQPTPSKTPYPNVQFTVPVRADIDLYDLGFNSTDTNDLATWSVELTKAYVAAAYPGQASFAFAVPDFHALAGWDASFQIKPGAALAWTAGTQHVVDVDWFFAAPPNTFFDHDGSELGFADVFGQTAVP